MSFELEVEFTGLCLFVRRNSIKAVTVLMPDCRRTLADDMHSDHTRGEPHVGYLRINLTNLAHLPRLAAGIDGGDKTRKVPPGSQLDGPMFEVLYQFDREQLSFGVAGGAPAGADDLGLPDFKVILGGRKPRTDLYGTKPSDSLLFRADLKGGTLAGRRGGGNWVFNGVSKNNRAYESQFAEVITWKRMIRGDWLDLTLADFGGGIKQRIRLKPDDDRKVRVKIANLCSTNPLEWESLTTHTVTTKDHDFKWLYRLYSPDISAMPIPEQTSDLQAFGTEDCTGGQGDE